MSFAFFELIRAVRIRKPIPRDQSVTLNCDTDEYNPQSLRQFGRWRQNTRRYYNDQFMQHCQRRRFY